MNAKASAGERKPAERIVFFDTLRGLTILSMVAFHTTYDLAYLYGYDMPWFTSTLFQDIWRASISWTFLILAGWMTQHSRNNLKRGRIILNRRATGISSYIHCERGYARILRYFILYGVLHIKLWSEHEILQTG